jgi:hypothetical protein
MAMTKEPHKPIGIYRSHGVLGLPNGVRIRDVDGAEKYIPEQRYRQYGYEPLFDDDRPPSSDPDRMLVQGRPQG